LRGLQEVSLCNRFSDISFEWRFEISFFILLLLLIVIKELDFNIASQLEIEMNEAKKAIMNMLDCFEGT